MNVKRTFVCHINSKAVSFNAKQTAEQKRSKNILFINVLLILKKI